MVKNYHKMVTITCACGCGESREVRLADVNRGWGKYLNKSHKARAQKSVHAKPKANKSLAEKVEKAYAPHEHKAKTLIKALQNGAIAWSVFAARYPSDMWHLLPNDVYDELMHDEASAAQELGWDGHK